MSLPPPRNLGNFQIWNFQCCSFRRFTSWCWHILVYVLQKDPSICEATSGNAHVFLAFYWGCAAKQGRICISTSEGRALFCVSALENHRLEKLRLGSCRSRCFFNRLTSLASKGKCDYCTLLAENPGLRGGYPKHWYPRGTVDLVDHDLGGTYLYGRLGFPTFSTTLICWISCGFNFLDQLPHSFWALAGKAAKSCRWPRRDIFQENQPFWLVVGSEWQETCWKFCWDGRAQTLNSLEGLGLDPLWFDAQSRWPLCCRIASFPKEEQTNNLTFSSVQLNDAIYKSTKA